MRIDIYARISALHPQSRAIKNHCNIKDTIGGRHCVLSSQIKYKYNNKYNVVKLFIKCFVAVNCSTKIKNITVNKTKDH